jgi:hypothetical protein
MKKLILVLLISSVNCYAQDFPSPFNFSVIDSCPCSKDDLYNRALLWVVKAYNSSKDVIQMQDKETGVIVCKALIEVPGQKNAFGSPLGIDYVDYTLTIKVKEGKYKIAYSAPN